MSKKLRFPIAVLLGIGLLLLTASDAVARHGGHGHGGHGHSGHAAHAHSASLHAGKSGSSGVAMAASLGQRLAMQARRAFGYGDYQEAMRLAGRAAVEMPQNAMMHQLMALASLSQKNYGRAASEAHTALALGGPIDWPTLHALYRDTTKYALQLRDLETFVRNNPGTPDGHFLLGYQYAMMGYNDAANTQFAAAAAINPADRLAERLKRGTRVQ
jgi:tetratricopeptide (TPR) repeat protein